MAGFHDRRAAQSREAARARIEAVYAHAAAREGVTLSAVPSNIERQIDRVIASDGDYLDQIRVHATRNASKASSGNFTSPGQVSPGTEPTSDPTPTSGAPAVDYRARAMADRPWLRGQLLDLFADFWAETGDSSAALVRLRGTTAYDSEFAGNKRSDGTLRMDENTYWSEREGVAEAAEEFGFDSAKYRREFGSLIEKGIDASEFLGAAEEAVARFTEPGGPRSELTETFLEQFTSSGSRSAALDATRNTDVYDRIFAGNKREDGSILHSEPEYRAIKYAVLGHVSDYGLNPDVYEPKVGALIAGEKSPDEFRAQMDALYRRIVTKSPEERAATAVEFGMDPNEVSDEAILGIALSPDIGNEVLDNRLTIAQITGGAQRFGFVRGRDRVTELMGVGLTADQARQFYQQAGTAVPRFAGISERFNEGQFGVADLEDAFIGGDVEDQTRMRRLASREQSLFSRQTSARRDQTGDLTGLQQR